MILLKCFFQQAKMHASFAAQLPTAEAMRHCFDA